MNKPDSQRFKFTEAEKIPGTLPAVLKDALYHDAALMILSSQIRGKIVNQNALCERLGISRHTLKQVIRHPEFIIIYEKMRDEHFAKMAESITDAKTDPVLREIALRSEVTSLAGEAVGELRRRIRVKKANSKDFDTAIKAYANIHDRSPGIRDKRSNNQHVHVHTFVPSPAQAAAMQEAESEADIDIADVLDVKDFSVEKEAS